MFNLFKSTCLSLAILLSAVIVPVFLSSEEPLVFNMNFSDNHNGFAGDFTDYPVGEEAFYELSWGWENLPKSVSSTSPLIENELTKGLFLSGNNHSDDLWMFVKRRLDGLKPNTEYTVNFSLLLESNVPEGLVGIGGSPGEGVTVKVGASTQEPEKIDQFGYYFLNVDKGNQSSGGQNALVVGSLANPLVDSSNPQYEPLLLKNEIPLVVTSDQNGFIWIFVGTDSGFEGLTKFYIAEINVDVKI